MKSSGVARASNQKRPSTKIFLGFLFIIAACWGGWQLYSDWRVSNIKFTPIEPGKVNLVGIDLSGGYRITVSNQVAQLVESRDRVDTPAKGGGLFGGFSMGGADQSDDSGGGSSSGSSKRRVPIAELIKSLQGDVTALGKFVMAENDLNEDDLPPVRVTWSDTDIIKALNGDPVLRAKLEKDLNVKLDGTPLPYIRPDAMWDGIVIQAHVPIHVNIGGMPRLLQAPILLPFKADLMSKVERDVEQKSNLTDDTIRIYYQQEAQKVTDANRENVAETLKTTVAPEHLGHYAGNPESILGKAVILINENYVTKASVEAVPTDTGTLYNLALDLTPDGVDRLWYYSKHRVGFQLLLISNGVAIAAPTIRHELTSSPLVITKLPDQALAKDAADTINNRSK